MKDMSEDKLLKFLTEAYNDMPEDDMYHTPDPVDDPASEKDLRLPIEKSEEKQEISKIDVVKKVLLDGGYIEDESEASFASRDIIRALFLNIGE